MIGLQTERAAATVTGWQLKATQSTESSLLEFNPLSDLNWPVMANHSGSGDPMKEWMIGLQTERAAATVTEDSTEEKAVARARMDVVTDAVMPISKLVTG
jgi:hypothetical protein